MATVSLFQKWRSQTFEDLVGQEVVVHTLRNALTSGHPSRVYLFCGPRGTGKTSTARILAKALNCEHGPTATPCNECEICRRITDGSCLDVMEIDAASHTQVDKIREYIVDKVQYAPSEARYKVYIIDEVHKLSTSSFNALLKTLEEPPAHVVFILATTDPQDIPPTILSRCQRHDFTRLSQVQISDRLMYVAEHENISLDRAAADIMARSADGAMRDAMVSLEQAATFTNGQITAEEVRSLFGLAGSGFIGELIDSLVSGQTAAALGVVDRLVTSGRDLGKFAGELIDYLRFMMLVGVKAASSEILGISQEAYADLEQRTQAVPFNKIMIWLSAFIELQNSLRESSRARLLWEMAVIKLSVGSMDASPQALLARIERLEKFVASGAPASRPAASVSSARSSSSLPSPTAVQGRPAASQSPYGQPVAPVRSSRVVERYRRNNPAPVPTEDIRSAGSSPSSQAVSPDDGYFNQLARKSVTASKDTSVAAPGARAVAAYQAEPLAQEIVDSQTPSSSQPAPVQQSSLRSAPVQDEWAEMIPKNVSLKEVAKSAGRTSSSRRVSNTASSRSASSSSTSVSPQGSSTVSQAISASSSESVAASSPEKQTSPASEQPARSQSNMALSLSRRWIGFLNLLKQQDKRAFGPLSNGKPVELKNGMLTISFPGNLAYYQSELQRNKAHWEDLLSNYLGQKTRYKFVAAEGQLSAQEAHDRLVGRVCSMLTGKVVTEYK